MDRLCNLTGAALEVLYSHRGHTLLVHGVVVVAFESCGVCCVETSVPASAACISEHRYLLADPLEARFADFERRFKCSK